MGLPALVRGGGGFGALGPPWGTILAIGIVEIAMPRLGGLEATSLKMGLKKTELSFDIFARKNHVQPRGDADTLSTRFSHELEVRAMQPPARVTRE